MALTTAFVVTCREAIEDLPELSTFRSALAGSGVNTRAERVAAYHAAHSGGVESKVYLLRKAIRDVVNAEADKSGTLSINERETAYQSLVAEFVPAAAKPEPDGREYANLETLIRQEALS